MSGRLLVTNGSFSGVTVTFTEGPVHWLVNVDGDPTRVSTACGRFQWMRYGDPLLDPDREEKQVVTCLDCLEFMADTAIVVEGETCQDGT